MEEKETVKRICGVAKSYHYLGDYGVMSNRK